MTRGTTPELATRHLRTAIERAIQDFHGVDAALAVVADVSTEFRRNPPQMVQLTCTDCGEDFHLTHRFVQQFAGRRLPSRCRTCGNAYKRAAQAGEREDS